MLLQRIIPVATLVSTCVDALEDAAEIANSRIDGDARRSCCARTVARLAVVDASAGAWHRSTRQRWGTH